MNLKFSLLIVFIFLFSTFIKAQVTTDPNYPTADAPVTVYFDATGTSLEGYTGDLYIHTGVILQGSTSWSHVIGDWGNNNNQPQLTRIGTDLYKLEITPSINSFYSVGASETVSKMAFVFRSADAGTQSSDILVDVYQATNELRILSPDSSKVFSLGDTIKFDLVALFADSIKVLINDTVYVASDTTTLSADLITNSTGKNYFTVTAFNATDTVTKQSYYFVREANNVQDLPTGIDVGITYLSDTSVILCLYAPGKDFIFVKGDFNDWNFLPDYQMNVTPDGNYFWIEIDGLTPQEEYAYQFNVDGEFNVADPYCDKILDPWNDQYIPSSTYPNLKPYPTGKADGIVSVFQTAQIPYQWKNDTFERPDKKDLVIYELLVRDFTEARNYQTMIDTLPYFKKLGISAIELMPINEFEGNLSWGYNPAFYFAPDKAYGTKDKLKEFIDSCHSNGIAVIMDVVYNHSYGQSPLVQLYLNRDTWKVTPDNPWYNVDSPNDAYSWGYDFNHESQATKDFIDKNIAYWLTEYKIDGYRFDFSKGFTNTTGDGWAYDQSRIDILEHYYNTVNSTSNGAYLILEHFCENSEEKVLTNYGMMVWANFNYTYAQLSMGYLDGSDFSSMSYLNRGWDNPYGVGYMESHDEERMMYRNLNWGLSNGLYDITDTIIALDRVKLASVLLFTIPGPKMLWQFEELGYDYPINYCPDGTIDESCRTYEKPVRWDYFENPYRKYLFDYIHDLILLRKELKISSCNDFTIDASGYVKQIVLNNDTSAVVVGNMDVKNQVAIISFPHSGMWYEHYTGDSLSSANDTITLGAGEFRIYTDYKLPEPDLPFAPSISNLSVEGDLKISDTVYVTYDYFDKNNDPEGASEFQWYLYSNEEGDDMTEISGATNKELRLTGDMIGKYIACQVTPVEESDVMARGNTQMTDIVGPVANISSATAVFPNPVITTVTFSNIQKYDKIIVTNLAGEIVDEFEVNHKKKIVRDYSNLLEGIYLVKMISTFETYNTKIIKWK